MIQYLYYHTMLGEVTVQTKRKSDTVLVNTSPQPYSKCFSYNNLNLRIKTEPVAEVQRLLQYTIYCIWFLCQTIQKPNNSSCLRSSDATLGLYVYCICVNYFWHSVFCIYFYYKQPTIHVTIQAKKTFIFVKVKKMVFIQHILDNKKKKVKIRF